MTNRPTTEQEIVDHLTNAIATSFSSIKGMATEVRSHGRASTDVLLITADDSLVGIEAKLTDWKRAIAQAFLNRCCVDRSYIALWSSAIRPDVLAEAEAFGLGVLSVEVGMVSVSLAAPNCDPDTDLRASVRLRLEDRVGSATE